MFNWPITWQSKQYAGRYFYHFGEDFEAIMALLEDHRQLEEQFESFLSDVSRKLDNLR